MDGKIVTKASSLRPGAKLITRFSDGDVVSEVRETGKVKKENRLDSLSQSLNKRGE